MKEVLLIVFLIMNIIGFFVCLKDKRAAIKDRCRVQEKTLFLIAFLWGAIGTYASMMLFRHKTKHWYFMVGMPLLILLNLFTLYKVIGLAG